MPALRKILAGAFMVLIGGSALIGWAVMREARLIGPELAVERPADGAPAPVLPRVRPPERADFLPG